MGDIDLYLYRPGSFHFEQGNSMKPCSGNQSIDESEPASHWMISVGPVWTFGQILRNLFSLPRSGTRCDSEAGWDY